MRYLFVLALAGCASMSNVAPYGNGLYVVSASGRGEDDPQKMAASEANDYCAKQGLAMEPQQQATMGTTATLTFRCTDKKKPPEGGF